MVERCVCVDFYPAENPAYLSRICTLSPEALKELSGDRRICSADDTTKGEDPDAEFKPGFNDGLADAVAGAGADNPQISVGVRREGRWQSACETSPSQDVTSEQLICYPANYSPSIPALKPAKPLSEKVTGILIILVSPQIQQYSSLLSRRLQNEDRLCRYFREQSLSDIWDVVDIGILESVLAKK